jgi:hypothetical protein
MKRSRSLPRSHASPRIHTPWWVSSGDSGVWSRVGSRGSWAGRRGNWKVEDVGQGCWRVQGRPPPEVLHGGPAVRARERSGTSVVWPGQLRPSSEYWKALFNANKLALMADLSPTLSAPGKCQTPSLRRSQERRNISPSVRKGACDPPRRPDPGRVLVGVAGGAAWRAALGGGPGACVESLGRQMRCLMVSAG